MGRNMQTIIENGKRIAQAHPSADLKVEEMKALGDHYLENADGDRLFDLIAEAYYMGVSIGAKVQKRKGASVA